MPLPPMTPPLPAAAAAMASCMAGILSCLTICCTSMLSQEPRLPAARPPPPPGPPPPRPPPRPILPPRDPPWDDFRRSIEFFRPVGEEEVRKCDVNPFVKTQISDFILDSFRWESPLFQPLPLSCFYLKSSLYFVAENRVV